jgi:hypothetical protein
VTLKQDGEKLTGHYWSQSLGEAEISGTVKGQQIEFEFNVEVQGFALQIRCNGAVGGRYDERQDFPWRTGRRNVRREETVAEIITLMTAVHLNVRAMTNLD